MACDGPDYTLYHPTLHTCVGSATQTSCSGSDTCYYAFIASFKYNTNKQIESGWFGGQFDDAGFRIECVGPLKYIGIKKGDVIQRLNGDIVLPDSLEKYTPENPIRNAEALRYHLIDRNAYGIDLTLSY